MSIHKKNINKWLEPENVINVIKFENGPFDLKGSVKSTSDYNEGLYISFEELVPETIISQDQETGEDALAVGKIKFSSEAQGTFQEDDEVLAKLQTICLGNYKEFEKVTLAWLYKIDKKYEVFYEVQLKNVTLSKAYRKNKEFILNFKSGTVARSKVGLDGQKGGIILTYNIVEGEEELQKRETLHHEKNVIPIRKAA